MADPTAEPTVAEAVARLRDAGFATDAFAVTDGVRCGACGAVHGLDDLEIAEVHRIEGVTDPADEAIVLGLQCRACGARAVLVAGYGPMASAEDADLVSALHIR